MTAGVLPPEKWRNEYEQDHGTSRKAQYPVGAD